MHFPDKKRKKKKKSGRSRLTQNGGNISEVVHCIKWHMRSSCTRTVECRQAKEAERKTSKRQSQEAHLTIAIRRQDYSIALTKYFENIVKLRERKAEK